jgi:hypothetical protein
VTCRDASEFLSSYLDGELEPDVHNLVENHLQSCSSCAAGLEELRQVKLALESLPELEPPPSLHTRVMAAVCKQARSEKQRPAAVFGKHIRNIWSPIKSSSRPGWLRRAGLVLAACLVVMIISSAGTVFLVRYGSWGAKSSAPDGAPRQFEDAGEPGLFSGTAQAHLSPEEGGETYGLTTGGRAMLESDGSPLSDSAAESSDQKMAASNSLSDLHETGIERKLIRHADLTLQVHRGGVDVASQEVIHVVRKHGGYIESSSMSVAQDKNQNTTFWVSARIPAESLDQAIEEISALGEVTRSDTSVQDVTDRYYDLDARIRSKEVQEQRLLHILGNANTVGELLQVEGELSRVRADIESMKGQQNVLEKSSSMSFLSMAIVEEGRKIQPSPWGEIWRVFVNAWKKLFLFAAQISPFVIVIAVIYLVVRQVIRKRP